MRAHLSKKKRRIFLENMLNNFKQETITYTHTHIHWKQQHTFVGEWSDLFEKKSVEAKGKLKQGYRKLIKVEYKQEVLQFFMKQI